MARKSVYSVEKWHELAHRAHYRSSALAAMLGICPRQLRRYTHEAFNQSPQAWLDDERLRIALGLLRQGQPVKTVAGILGFRQVSHFSREFKKFYGLSPVAFIRWFEETRLGKKSAPDNFSLLSNSEFANRIAPIPRPLALENTVARSDSFTP